MKLVVGLGNPGPRYEATRHNVGFRVVEGFAARHGIALDEQRFDGRFGRGRCVPTDGEPLDVGVLEPLCFMNRSGDPVAQALAGLPVEDPSRDLLIVLDDVDLPFGRLRVRPSGGAGGHKGLADILRALGRDDLPRLRFGVGRSEIPMDTAEWVLQPFAEEEEERLGERLAAAGDAVEAVLAEGVAPAMNRFNRDPAAEPATR